MEAALGNHVDTLVTKTVEQGFTGAGCVHLHHHIRNHGIGVFAPDRQFFSFFFPPKQLAQDAVSLRCGSHGGINVDKRNSSLPCQSGQIISSGFLCLADVDYHIRCGSQKSFQIHFTLAAVKLPDFCFFIDIGGQIALRIFCIGSGYTYQHVTGQGQDVDLGQGAGNGNPCDFCRKGYGSACGIRKFLCFLSCIYICLSAAAKQKGKNQKNYGCFFHIYSSLFGDVCRDANSRAVVIQTDDFHIHTVQRTDGLLC